MREWYCALYGQPQGPFSEERMREMALRGEILSDTLVWCGSTSSDATRGWVRAAETAFAQFFPADATGPEPLRAPLLSEGRRESATPEGGILPPPETPAPLPRAESLPGDAPEPLRAPLLSQMGPAHGAFGGTSSSDESPSLREAFFSRLGAVADVPRGLRVPAPAAIDPAVAAALAPREVRLAAFMINLVIPCAFFLIFKSLPAFFFFRLRFLAVSIAGATVLIALACLGFGLCFLSRDGQSLGKKALRIRITDLDGGRTPLWRIAGLRWIVSALVLILLWVKPVLGIALFLADAALIFRRDRRTLRDLIAGTVVVTVRTGGEAGVLNSFRARN